MDGTGEGRQDSEWGPFGRPLFDDPAAHALERVGVLDVGSNSVRLVVFDGAARSPAYFYNEKIMCALGADMAQTGRLNPKGRDRALAAIRRFQLLADAMGISPLTAVATAAMREAEDGPEFRARIERETGLKLWVIDGEEEARLSAQGVLLGWPGAQGLICDIGGSSMELAELRDGQVGRRISSRLGPLRLQALDGGKKAMKKVIAETMDDLVETMGKQPDRLFLVGGSWRAIARIDMERRQYPLAVLHEYRMTRKDILATVDYIQKADIEELRGRTGLGAERMALVPTAALVLAGLVTAFKPGEIAISSYGIREGMLFEQMPQKVRERDPLIEACRHMEAKDARMPGFGRRLFHFIEPIFAWATPERLRIIRAACLLHDVSWRAHPDYRHEVCFETATRANLGGMTHAERIFLGVALLHRYKNNREGSRFTPFFEMLSADELHDAEVVGKAMRFGAMLSVQTPELMGAMAWHPRKKLLEMKIARGAEALFGEVVEARFMALAGALGAETKIERPR